MLRGIKQGIIKSYHKRITQKCIIKSYHIRVLQTLIEIALI